MLGWFGGLEPNRFRAVWSQEKKVPNVYSQRLKNSSTLHELVGWSPGLDMSGHLPLVSKGTGVPIPNHQSKPPIKGYQKLGKGDRVETCRRFLLRKLGKFDVLN